MKQNKLHTAKLVRFRRWSRAGYAVFSSLACSVSIGCLVASISDKSLQKAVSHSTTVGCLKVADSGFDDDFVEQADLDLAILQLKETNLLNETLENAAACAINIFNI